MDVQISLTPQLEALVRQKIESGVFSSASEVVGAALRLMAERDASQTAKLEQLRREIHDGLDSGPSVQLDAADIATMGRALRFG